MDLWTDVAVYGAAACYLGATLATAWYLLGVHERALHVAAWLLGLGAACLGLTFALRWATWHRVPFTSAADSVNLLALQATVVLLFMTRSSKVRGLICFCAPVLTALCLIAATVAHADLHEMPRELRGFPLTLHVGLAFLAYALFLLASATSAAYIFQARHLKRHQSTALFQRLPSLEHLDHTLWRLVTFAYPLFVVTLVLGVVWSWVDRDLLGPRWWLAPKIVLSTVMATFYGVVFHARRSGGFRGPKLAYLIFLGFLVLLGAYLVLSLTDLNTARFWEAAK